MKTFVIGDIHGHYNRLVALLAKAGVMRWTPGEHFNTLEPTGAKIEVVMVGDVAQMDAESRVNDLHCYELAKQIGAIVLYGNHDYAAIKPMLHAFRGYQPPTPELREAMMRVTPRFAYATHGYLITHAGLHPKYGLHRFNVKEIAERLNQMTDEPEIDDIGPYRGGWDAQGGILWRDAREDLAPVPQIFGHTRGLVRQYLNGSVCIDVGEKREPGNLVGIMLPERRLYAVGPDASLHEVPLLEAE